MRKTAMTAAVPGAVLTASGTPGTARAEREWQWLDIIFQRESTDLPGGGRRFALARADLHVTLDGVPIRPALALGSWLAFTPFRRGEASVRGDLVLTQEEVTPVMRVLVSSPGLRVTALHNHLLHTEPSMMDMHVSGRGDAMALAQGLCLAIGQSRTPIAPVPQAEQPREFDLNTAAVDRILGHRGQAAGGVYAVSVPHPDVIRERDVAVPDAPDLATAIAIQPLGGGQAAATGDLVLLGSEVDPVARMLAHHRIEVTTLHGDALAEEPRLFVLHFWGVGDAGELAQGLRAALDQTSSG